MAAGKQKHQYTIMRTKSSITPSMVLQNVPQAWARDSTETAACCASKPLFQPT